MNKVILCGRLTRDPDVRQGGSDGTMTIARFTLAVDRWRGKSGDQEASADFISCIGFGKRAEFLEKYCHKGTKLILEGNIQTGKYTNKEGQMVYTTDVIADNLEFAESAKAAGSGEAVSAAPSNNRKSPDDSFLNVPDDVDEELPFR